MISNDSSLPTRQVAESSTLSRLPEIDKFVDHFLSMMCDRSRRQILELLAAPANDEPFPMVELRSGEIAKKLGLAPATASGHLHQLLDAGLIASRREGNAIYYRLSNYMLFRAFRDLLLALDNEHASRLKN